MLERDKFADALRGLAIILVVMGHVMQVGKHNNFDCFTNPIFIAIYSFHMPLFMCISGFVAHYSLKSGKPMLTAIKMRFLFLIIPFLAWAAIDSFWNTSNKINPETLNGYIANAILYPGNYPALWYLWVLFFCSLLLVISINLEKYLKLLSYPVVWVIVLLIPYSDYYNIFMIKWMFPFISISYLINRYKDKFKKDIILLIKIISFVAFPICIYYWNGNDYIFMSKMIINYNNMWSTVSNWGYMYITAFFGIINSIIIISWIKKTFVFEVLCKVGLVSMDVYILETFFFIILSKKLQNIANGYIFYLVYIPITTIVITLLCLLFGKYILRKNSYVRMILLGGK